MANLHLFNPDNDLALAANLDNYTPPRAAMQLRRDAELLPLWYGEPDDCVVCHGVNAAWLERKQKDFPGLCNIWDHNPGGLVLAPWGWSKAVRKTFRREGIPDTSLPSPADIEYWRGLSHRRTAALIHRRLIEMLPDIQFPHPAEEVTNVRELEMLLDKCGDVYVKLPWSGSGRGIVCSVGNHEGAMHQAGTFIDKQGSALVEPALTRARDFARLFRCRADGVDDLGTSIFTTDASGHYTSNLLAPENERFAQLSNIYPAEKLERVFAALREIIREEIQPHYQGVLGVDMLITTDGLLHPAVELNLRHTMGYVANRFAEMHLHSDARGKFYIIPFKNAAELPQENYCTENGRLLSGCLHLCPTPTSGFAVIVETI